MPLATETLVFWAEEGLLNSVASCRTWVHQTNGEQNSVAFWDMVTTLYAEWFVAQEFNVVKGEHEELDDSEMANIVEAALALHVMKTLGGDLRELGDTLVFTNWLVHSLLTQ